MVFAQGVVGLGGGKEVARNQFGALMDKLIEGVLPIGARFTPDDGPCLVINWPTGTIDILAVTLHITLLEIGGEPVQVLVVRQDRLGLCIEKVVIPDSQYGHDDWYVFFKGCMA